jgi:hypothetical protein
MHDLKFLQGQAAERRRLGAILLSPEAVGLERAAIELAFGTTLKADAARRTLESARGAPAHLTSRRVASKGGIDGQ